MSRQALIIVDIQNDYFPAGKWPLVNVQAAAENAARALNDARTKGDLVVHIRHEFPSSDAPFFAPGTTGAEPHPLFVAQTGEPVLVKQQINAFRDTQLHQLLSEQQVERLVVVGNMSHMCIDAIVRAAVDLGYDTIVLDDACATLDLSFNGKTVPAAQVHAAFMSALSFAYAKVQSTDEYLAQR